MNIKLTKSEMVIEIIFLLVLISVVTYFFNYTMYQVCLGFNPSCPKTDVITSPALLFITIPTAIFIWFIINLLLIAIHQLFNKKY